VRSGLELQELDAGRFTAQLDLLTGIYALAMDTPTSQLAGRRSIMERHTAYPGFRAVVALAPGGLDRRAGRPAPVGFAYGFHGEPGQWWHDLVLESLASERDSEEVAFWLGDSFEIAEVHVHPNHQGRGIGRQLMHRLADGRPERTALLSTPEGKTRARRLYASLGLVDLLPGFSFPGAGPPYAIMGAVLPLRDSPAPPDERSASPSRW
jgi:GNAT superfamily N-acetyltransferase